MIFTSGLESLKKNIYSDLLKEADALKRSFEKIKGELGEFVAESTGAYKSLRSFFENKDIPHEECEPNGFLYGHETISSISSQDAICFPKIYQFNKVAATAIEENSICAPLFFNFVLRSIISYPIGDSIVYMLDSNVSGDFNSLSPICTELGDTDTAKNMFHYITKDEDKDRVLTELIDVMDRNIRNYISKYPDLYSYNTHNQQMREPYYFVFIKNIAETFNDKQQIEKLTRLIHSQNATKAGIFIFYTYDKKNIENKEDIYFSEVSKAVHNLLRTSHLWENVERLYVDSELSLEPKATYEIVSKVINYVNTQTPPVTVMTFKEEITRALSKGVLWESLYQGDNSHLYFPVGYQNPVTKQEVDISFSGVSPHLFIGGKTGSGKSILLHNLILNGALRYSPEQLQFYLVDMKGGVSFVNYKHLPHVAALCASSNRHYAESLLEMFCNEIEKRNLLFKREGVFSLSGYNESVAKNNGQVLPYIFGIIDEFQELFPRLDSIANKSQEYIEKIHKLGRAAGVFIALCTQSPPSNIDRSQVGIKMALICTKENSAKLIGNEGASKLRGIGRAIINTSESGEERYNQEFQVAFVHEKKELPIYVEQIKKIYLKQHHGIDKLVHMVYDDNDQSSKLSDNPALMYSANTPLNHIPYIYIGVPGFYRKEHVKFCFHRDSQSNVAICGSDRPAALRLVGIIAIQFIHYYKQFGTKVYVSDLQKQTEPTYNQLGFLSSKSGVSYSNTANLKKTIEEVYQILNNRKQDPAKSVHEPEVLYAIIDMKPDSNFSMANSSMFSFGGTPEATPISMLKELIIEGPDYGIHVLVYSYNYTNMEILKGLELLTQMEIKIALRGGNSFKLLSNYGTQEIIDQYGKGFINMPPEMGLKYVDGDGLGDPFLIYDTLGDDKFKGSVWDTLFTSLPNKKY